MDAEYSGVYALSMAGYHEVKSFPVSAEELSKGWVPPKDFKPFAALAGAVGYVIVICRKWHQGWE
jgi:hypothetical protein